MTPIVLGVIGFVVVLAFLLLFARGGIREASSNASVTSRTIDPEDFVASVRSLLKDMGFALGEPERAGIDKVEFTARDSRPILGQRLYVRIFLNADDPTESSEVLAALDELKGGFHKGLLFSRVGFSDEAKSAADGTPIELMDASSLASLRHYPPPANSAQKSLHGLHS